MSAGYNRDRWPDGLALSVPLPWGRVGGTYYWNPGAPPAPPVTVTRSYGVPGAGLETVFLVPGVTSNDTIGYGISGNVSTGIPSVTLNSTFPRAGSLPDRLSRPKVTSVGAGAGTFNASPALTATYTPEEIADFLGKYLFPPVSGPEASRTLVRDSASTAGVPGRNNVFEYGYPEPGATPTSERGPPGLNQEYLRNHGY